VRKSERACNPQTSTAANGSADYEELITAARITVSRLIAMLINKPTPVFLNTHQIEYGLFPGRRLLFR
jgi:hypothetical protein